MQLQTIAAAAPSFEILVWANSVAHFKVDLGELYRYSDGALLLKFAAALPRGCDHEELSRCFA